MPGRAHFRLCYRLLHSPGVSFLISCVVDACRDVPDMLVEWRNAGIKTYIYSSGSREAQRLFFGHSQAGDLRPFLSGFFDTTSGLKNEAASYANIQHTLGVDDPDQVCSTACSASAGHQQLRLGTCCLSCFTVQLELLNWLIGTSPGTCNRCSCALLPAGAVCN